MQTSTQQIDKRNGIDIDSKIKAIESSVQDLRGLLHGLPTNPLLKYVDYSCVKSTLETLLFSLKPPLIQISSTLSELNPNDKQQSAMKNTKSSNDNSHNNDLYNDLMASLNAGSAGSPDDNVDETPHVTPTWTFNVDEAKKLNSRNREISKVRVKGRRGFDLSDFDPNMEFKSNTGSSSGSSSGSKRGTKSKTSTRKVTAPEPPPPVVEETPLFPEITTGRTTADDLLASLNLPSTSHDDLMSQLSALNTSQSLNDVTAELMASLDNLGKPANDNFSQVEVQSNNEQFSSPLAKPEIPEESEAACNLMNLFSKPSISTKNVSSKRTKSSKGVGQIPSKSQGQALGLFRQYSVREEVNKTGLKRVKKPQMKFGGKFKTKLQMEDTNIIQVPFAGESKRALFAVFDGHVDRNAAEDAKLHFPGELDKLLRQHTNPRDAKDPLREVFYVVDKILGQYEYEGTTATAAYLWQAGEDRYLQVANVGDSTAFLCRNGQAVWVTKDHKVSEPEEFKRMKESGFPVTEGQTRINGLAVSRALGDHFVKQNELGVIVEPYVSPVYKLDASDTLLIVATDGVSTSHFWQKASLTQSLQLWDVMTGQEACDLIKSLDSADDMAKKLTRTALHSPKCNDNITVIVICL